MLDDYEVFDTVLLNTKPPWQNLIRNVDIERRVTQHQNNAYLFSGLRNMYDTPEHLPYHEGISLSDCLSRSVSWTANFIPKTIILKLP